MNQLIDSLLSALLVAECRDKSPLHRLLRAVVRVEELLNSIGATETAKTLRKLRLECGEFPSDPPPDAELVSVGIVAEPGDDPLIDGARRRRKAVNRA